MRNSLLLLLSSVCLCLKVHAQTTPPIVVTPGEYQVFLYHSSDKILYALGGAVGTQGLGTVNPTQQLGIPQKVAFPAGTQMKNVSSGLHSGIGVDMNGNVWFWGVNDGGMRCDGTIGGATTVTPVLITKDASGNAFTNVNQVSAFWWDDLSPNNENSSGVLACKNDGTVWIWGNAHGGFIGNGTEGGETFAPTQIVIPGNPHIVKVLAGDICMALDNNGNVYTWGGENRNILLGTNATNYMVVNKVPLAKPAKDIAGAQMFSYALCADGTLYGWGIYGAYLGNGTGSYLASNVFEPLPIDLTAGLHLPHPITQIMCNSICTHVILSDSTLWGWGDNTEGNVGNGIQINFGTYTPVYEWDWGAAEVLQHPPVQIAPQIHNFVAIFAGAAACFYNWAETATGQLYSWGRNKSEVLANGVMGAVPDLEASYPDSWEQPTITAINPFGLTKIYPSTSPYCLLNPGSFPCSEYKIPADVAPVSVAGANQTINLPASTGVLNGSGSHDADGVVVYYKWRQVSGPSANTVLDSTYQSTRLSGLVAGTYVYSLTVTDNGWATNTSTVTVTVKAAGNVGPTVSAGSGVTITLPTTSATLAGSATGNNGATIKSLSWKEASGPATATIASPASTGTAISGLTAAGTYVFTFTATDNNNLAASANVSVVVNAATATTPPTVSAGKGQSITLPATSITLTGTATGNGGATINTLTWKESSGPATATISSPASLSTTVSGLTVAGSYVFTLYATDNNGKSANGSMTVAVKAATTTAPTVSAGGDPSITLPTSSVTLTGSATGNNGATIKSVSWKESSGPATATIASPTSVTTVISGLTVVGTYVFTLTATDNNNLTSSGSVDVVVNPATTATPPTVNAGKGQAITLPTSSTTLTGTATGNGGATIKTLTWKESSGPATATISSPGSLSTSVSGLTMAGNYVFTLYATDNNGKTSNGSMTITVNPAVITPPVVNAGVTQTIQLPTSSVTLSGTGSGTNGATITGIFWQLISGPAWVKFSNEWALTTTVSQMTVAGTYVFQLSVTDNNGQTSTSLVDVIVKAAATAAVDSSAVTATAAFVGDSVDSRPLLLFPNPVHDLLNVRVNSAGLGKVLIVIYNAMGNRVQRLQVEKDQWMLQTSIDVSRLAQGVYTLQVLTGAATSSTRFVKL